MSGRYLPERDPGYIDAEFRDLGDEQHPDPVLGPISCPNCGKDAAPCFGMCYHCMQPFRAVPQRTFWEMLSILFRVDRKFQK